MTVSIERKMFLHSVFVTALEGGIGYWCAAEKYHWSVGNKGEEDDLDGFYAVIVDDGEDAFEGKLRIDSKVIARGINLITSGKVSISDSLRREIREASRENDAGIMDAGSADCVVQAGLFGEIVFG